jgi:hypothetical protein
MCKYHNYYHARANRYVKPCNWSENKRAAESLPALWQCPAHATATAMHFPVDACLIFLTDKLTNDRFLVDTGATLSIIPCSSNSNPSGPLLKGANGKQIPSGGFITETVQFQGKMFTSGFLQAAVAGPILGIDFLRNSKSLLLQKPARSCLHVQQRPCPETFLPTFAQFPAAPPAPPGPQDTSPSPALPVRVSQVDMSNSSRKGHQSMLDQPLSVLSAAEPTPTQPIPDCA